MGLCNFKFFLRKRTAAELLRGAIIEDDVKLIELWTETESTSERDVVVGDRAEPAVLMAVARACKAEVQEEKDKTMKTLETLLRLGFNANACSKDAVAISPTYTAARYGRDDIIRHLLRYGANPSTATLQGQTPIIMAAALGYPDCVRVLLEAGVDASTLTMAINGTALHLTAPSGHPSGIEIVKLLLAHGANINKRNRPGRTPLHCACETRRNVTEMVAFLLDNGAEINSQDNRGYSPLMRSMTAGNINTAMMLLERGADATLKDNEGKTARDMGEAKRSLTTEDVERVFGKRQTGGLTHL